MSHPPAAPSTPPLRPTLHPNAKPRPPHLRVVDTSLKPGEAHPLREDEFDDRQCSPLSPVSSSPWEDASAASTTASIPSTPTTQVSVNEPLLPRDLLPGKPQFLSQAAAVPEAVRVPPESLGGPIRHIPPRWALRGDIYTFAFWTSAGAAGSLPEHVYSPLEGATSFADGTISRPVGGLSMIQILSYSDSPVGPYDEMIVAPGSFDWERTEPGGEKTRGSNPKTTRVYVSTPNSCFNGRTNWNTPKHLAKFVWDHSPDGSTTIKIYPHDDPSNPDESRPSSAPFFQTTFRPMPLVPRFPFATSWADHLGFNTTIVMPPLPAGRGTYGELPSTSRWISLPTRQYCARSTMGWYDVAQPDGGAACGGHENFLPWLGRWQVGLKMQDADLTFEMPEIWEKGDKLSGDSAASGPDGERSAETPEAETTEAETTEAETTEWRHTTFLHDYFS